MAKGTKKTATNANKTRGRQSDFSGEQLVYLDGLAKDFHNRKDRGVFYNEAAQGLIDKFGYSRDGKVFVQADTLNSEERVEYYQALRSVSVNFAMKCFDVLTKALLRKWASGSVTGTWPNPRTEPTLQKLSIP